MRSESNRINKIYNFRNRNETPPTKEFNIDDNRNKKVNFILTSSQKDNNKAPSNNIFNVTNTSDNYGAINNAIEYNNSNINIGSSKYDFNDNNQNSLNNNYTFGSANNYNSYNYSNYGNNNYLNNKNVSMLSEIKESHNEMNEEIINDEESSHGPIYQVVCNIVPPGKQVILYNIDLNTIIRKNIEFSRFTGISHFLDECAWVNHNNKLYILGGTDDFNKPSQIFLEYDPIKNVLKRLPDSKYTHSRHSLFSYNNQIFVVGGDRLECEKYDILNNEWSILPNLSFKQIYPVLYVHNDILYSFFGIDENIRKTDNAQKLNLKNSRGKWTRLIYKRNDCNLSVYGCGIAKNNDNCIIFLGGMDDSGIRKDAIKFDFSNLTATKTDYQLKVKAYFKDSVLLKLNQKTYGNFSIEEHNPFLKIKFNNKFN